MYCHYVTININTNHTSNNEEHKTCVILVLVKKDDDTKTITDCTNCVVNRKILTLTRKKTILFVDRGYGSTKHKGYHFQCKPVTLIWISFGKFAWPLQVASQASRLYIRKHNAWRGDRHRHSKNAFLSGQVWGHPRISSPSSNRKWENPALDIHTGIVTATRITQLK